MEKRIFEFRGLERLHINLPEDKPINFTDEQLKKIGRFFAIELEENHITNWVVDTYVEGDDLNG